MTEEQNNRIANSWIVVTETDGESLMPAAFADSEGQARAEAIELVLGDENPATRAHIYQRAGTVSAEVKPVWTGARP